MYGLSIDFADRETRFCLMCDLVQQLAKYVHLRPFLATFIRFA